MIVEPNRFPRCTTFRWWGSEMAVQVTFPNGNTFILEPRHGVGGAGDFFDDPDNYNAYIHWPGCPQPRPRSFRGRFAGTLPGPDGRAFNPTTRAEFDELVGLIHQHRQP